jgi:hypothetical protein
MVYIHNGILFSHKKYEILSYAGKWVKLEIIVLSEIREAQKSQILHIFAYMQNAALK